MEGGKVCSRCGKEKPLGAFSPNGPRPRRAACRACCRIDQAERRRTPEVRAWAEAYRERPEVRARKREHDRRRRAKVAERRRRREATPIGKLVKAIANARYRLAHPPGRALLDPDRLERRRARYLGVIDRCRRDLERLRAIYHGEDAA